MQSVSSLHLRSKPLAAYPMVDNGLISPRFEKSLAAIESRNPEPTVTENESSTVDPRVESLERRVVSLEEELKQSQEIYHDEVKKIRREKEIATSRKTKQIESSRASFELSLRSLKSQNMDLKFSSILSERRRKEVSLEGNERKQTHGNEKDSFLLVFFFCFLYTS
mmetsp:Transcript_39812/g.45391  ORF Transcript_39812/g.45391 Transcript_39812/m.45391 type:complete len:166 (+) Transcript_39812:2368-2865(+)